ncbi:hypothetical protein WKI71_00155 [Streptomyces sp. MS1.AVA.1]|uniref:RHS repeat protein n=1 Tax=Streptomyces machairae TaxID=3134109 RepID=A0ABU8UF49_9ACTN
MSTTTCRDADSCWTSFSSYYLNESDPLDPRNDKPLSYRDQRSSDHKDNRYRTAYTYNAQGLPLTTVRPDDSTATTTYTTGAETALGGGTTPPGLILTESSPGERRRRTATSRTVTWPSPRPRPGSSRSTHMTDWAARSARSRYPTPSRTV